MCGRYYIADEDMSEELAAIVAEVQRRTAATVDLGEMFPSEVAPVIANNRAGRAAVFAMRWGFSQNGALIINARSETAAEKPLFRESMARWRCLIPASHYFEWEKRGGERIKYAIGAGKMIYMAGLYRQEADGPAFTILTRAPSERVAFIHDRMPVLLPAEAHEAWLDAGRPGGAALALKAAVTELRFERAG